MDNPPLKRPKIIKLPKSILILDTEAIISYPDNDTMNFTFKMGCMIFLEFDNHAQVTSKKIYTIKYIDDFYITIENLCKKHKEIYIFGHNIGFDLRLLLAFRQFRHFGFLSSAPIINQRIFIWSLKRGKNKIKIVDTANLGVISVEQLGKDLNLPKLKADFENDSDEKLIEYCIRDCEILEKFLIGYIQLIYEHKLGGFKLTIASQALHTFLHKFYHEDIHPHHFIPAVQLEKDGYHGGRSEVFFLGKKTGEDFYLLDINSMYPSIMYDSYLPNKLKSYIEDDDIAIPLSYLSKYYLIAECEIDTDENCYPLMINNRLCFPLGKFKTVLQHSEFMYALLHSHIIKVTRLCVYYKGKIFSDYAKFFLYKRHEYQILGNKTYSYICKLFGNSLYGKMAQANYKRRKLIDYPDNDLGRIPFYDVARKISGQYILWDNIIYKEWKEGYARHTFLAIAGAITANGRMLLYSLMQKSKRENVYLCDTDSLLVNLEGYRALASDIAEPVPGKLKIDKQSKRLVIHGVKDYELGNKIRHKGIKQKAIEIEQDAFEQWNWSSMLSWLNSGGQGPADAKRIVKHRKGDYYKGIVDDKSGRITPYSLD